ncbi:MAG: 3-dehydroquinate synthase [Cyclobacteriaceae bacterium]|nr:3-dehydroquinate synthase [Cyclobacteriaceae bacterium]
MYGSVLIESNANQLLSGFLKEVPFTQLAVLVDENTSKHCYPLIQSALPNHHVIEVAAGEEFKNLTTCTRIWQQLTDLQFDRHALVIIIGGGVLGDMGGFCAATYKRGINFILMPTTLLAQVDASIGGKLGIDFNNFKNHIGVFQEPVATLISTQFLGTLPHRELRSGFAEILKHCLIADKSKWEEIILNDLTHQNWAELIAHSVKVKKEITEADPRERGLRKTLNFGHTLGHALETFFLNSPHRLFHGEAIAMGMIMESFIAHQKELLSKKELDSICRYILSVFGKIDNSVDQSQVIALTLQDKKNKGSKVLMALPQGIGKAIWDVEVSEKEMMEAIGYYQSM